MNSKYLTTTLSEVSQIFSGFAFKSKDLSVADGVPVIKIANIQNKQVLKKCNYFLPFELLSSKFNKYILMGDDVLIAMTGAGSVGRIGKMRRMEKRYLVNQRVAIVRIDKSVADPEYVYQVLSDDYYESYLYGLGLGAGQPNVSPSDIGHLEIPLPSLPTQGKIASILSAYDDLIENNTRRIRILEEMAQSLYREWFVHFRFPGHEKVKLVNSPLGKIPEGWEIVNVDDIATVYRGRSYRSVDLVDSGGLPFINLKCIKRGGGFRHDGIKRYQGKFKENQIAKPGDIIMAVTDMTQERGIVARVALIPSNREARSVFSMDLVKIVPDNFGHKEYLYGMFSYSDFSDKVKEHASGTNVLHLSHDRIKEYELLVPPSNLIEEFFNLSSNVSNECDIFHMQNENLRRTRNLILPKLISGDVVVKHC